MGSPGRGVRNAVITGGSGGIGKACGRALVERGYDVILKARREGPLRAAAKEIGARWVVADASDPAAFGAAVAGLTRVDLLVHAAGTLGGTYARKQSVEQWRTVMSANLDSCFVVTQAALPLMQPGSRFVFISSSAAHEPMPGRTAYSASKAGMNPFARALALEVDRDGINVNTVTPGPVETEMLQETSLQHERQMIWVMNWVEIRRGLEALRSAQNGACDDLYGVVGSLLADAEALRATGYRALENDATGRPSPEADILKLLGSTTLQCVWEAAAGAAGSAAVTDPDLEFERHDALAATIYGGTSEIQRNIIGERLLGLPKG